MDLRLTRSSFRSIYAMLSIFYVLVSVAFHFSLMVFVQDRILEGRAENIASLFRANDGALHLNDTRALRDELVARQVIPHDMGFSLLKPQGSKDKDSLKRVLEDCEFTKASVCVGPNEAVFFDPAMRSSDALNTSSYAVLLQTTYFGLVDSLIWWDALGCLLFGCVFIGFGLVIRRKELRLVAKLNVVLESVRSIQNSFLDEREAPIGGDEFLEMSQTVDLLSDKLRITESHILGFKKRFEKKARLEQLAHTIASTSHDLKAPLEETADFIHHLPDYIDSISRDELREALSSIERRLRSGLDSLDDALKKTQRTVEKKEVVRLGELVREFEEDLRRSKKFSTLTITRNLPTKVLNARVNVIPSKVDAVLWNLAKNSFEAHQAAVIEISGDVANGEVQLFFKDNGPGIPWFERKRLFEDFSSTKEGSGWGLGLAGCRNALGEFGGAIEALESEQGAIFELRLPLVSYVGKAEVTHGTA